MHRLCIGGSWGVQGFFMGCSGVVCTRVFRRQVEEVVFMSLTLVGWVRAMRGVSGFLLEVEVQSVMYRMSSVGRLSSEINPKMSWFHVFAISRPLPERKTN